MARQRLKSERLSLVVEKSLRDRISAYKREQKLRSLNEAARRLLWQALSERAE